MLLTKQQILSADDLPFEDVDVPEWGGTVRVRVMTGLERDAWEASVFQQKDGKAEFNQRNFRASLIARCISDESGEVLFTDDEILSLGRKSSKALDRVFKVASRINAISNQDQEELAKN